MILNPFFRYTCAIAMSKLDFNNTSIYLMVLIGEFCQRALTNFYQESGLNHLFCFRIRTNIFRT